MKKILVAEDESVIAMNPEEHLTEMGYGVVGIASTGDEAIAKARELGFIPKLYGVTYTQQHA